MKTIKVDDLYSHPADMTSQDRSHRPPPMSPPLSRRGLKWCHSKSVTAVKKRKHLVEEERRRLGQLALAFRRFVRAYLKLPDQEDIDDANE